MQIPLYELIYEDYTRYPGGSIKEPKWRESPDKAILYFKLRLPSGDFLQLSGYEEYNFFIEAVQGVMGNFVFKTPYLYLMGCKNGIVTSYRISLNEEGQKIGDTTIRKFPKGQEYNGQPTSGWHKGG